jgi:hypothetical protein
MYHEDHPLARAINEALRTMQPVTLTVGAVLPGVARAAGENAAPECLRTVPLVRLERLSTYSQRKPDV